jgi:hypothetical protein
MKWPPGAAFFIACIKTKSRATFSKPHAKTGNLQSETILFTIHPEKIPFRLFKN